MQTPSARPLEIHPQNKAPYAINSDQAQVLAQAIREGNYMTTACRIAGVNYDTVQDWLVRGGDPDSNDKTKPKPGEEVEPYLSFRLMIRAAEADAEAAALKNVRKAGSNDWRAEAWFLARRHNDRWGEKNTGVQVSTTGSVQFYLPENNRDNLADESTPSASPAE